MILINHALIGNTAKEYPITRIPPQRNVVLLAPGTNPIAPKSNDPYIYTSESHGAFFYSHYWYYHAHAELAATGTLGRYRDSDNATMSKVEYRDANENGIDGLSSWIGLNLLSSIYCVAVDIVPSSKMTGVIVTASDNSDMSASVECVNSQFLNNELPSRDAEINAMSTVRSIEEHEFYRVNFTNPQKKQYWRMSFTCEGSAAVTEMRLVGRFPQ